MYSKQNVESLRKKLMGILKNGTEQERVDASYPIFELGLCDAGELIPFLQDTNHKVRENIVQALGATEDSSAIPYLLSAVQDSSWQVQGRAIVALCKIDPAMLESALEKLGSNPPEWVVFSLLEYMVSIPKDDRSEIITEFILSIQNSAYSKPIKVKALSLFSEEDSI